MAVAEVKKRKRPGRGDYSESKESIKLEEGAAMAVAPRAKTTTVRAPRSKVSVRAAAPPAAPTPVRHQTVRLKEKAQVTIPYRIRRQLGLQEGDHFEVTVEDGKIVLEPVAVLSATGQRMLEEGLQDIREGRVHTYENFAEGLEALRHAIGLD